MITTELVFVRHGQAQCNADGVVGGPATCTGLTPLGFAQVRAAAQHLTDEHRARPFTTVLAGPRRRLQETAGVLAQTLGLPVTVDPALDGPKHGEADGKRWYDVKTTADGGPHAHPDRPWAAGSDTWNGYLQRAGAFLHDLIDQHTGERILFAAHGETVLAAHTLMLGIPLGAQADFTVSHGSITRWEQHLNRLGQRRWMLHQHNNTAHLTGLDTRPTP